MSGEILTKIRGLILKLSRSFPIVPKCHELAKFFVNFFFFLNLIYYQSVKQFESKLFDTLLVFLKDIFEEDYNFEKYQQMT